MDDPRLRGAPTEPAGENRIPLSLNLYEILVYSYKSYKIKNVRYNRNCIDIWRREMAFDLITIKCPECNGVLSVEAGKKDVHCSYCGAKILLYDDNEYTYHYVDEAEVENAKVKKQIREKEIELELRKIDFLEKKRKRIEHAVFAIILGALLCFIVYVIGDDCSSNPDNNFWMFGLLGVIIILADALFAACYTLVTLVLDHKIRK